ncbi:AsnC-like helix-turn-helix protein [Halohasta litchfieldiae]|jgi:DNA-binding Lrp family transcriptional regulator|uniref:Transcriptional regulator, AsnC family n=1 Tax=Halohasta litchfieldiae TaxID=1073996 RepID=A0A1H6RKP4_9EURY|nr:Lrp/AsnC family transcriptional regulator [Halohasta litchfieldiae]ATW89762.1 AsnC-like helix-turn-helix protein [Halohasta litchfieldiae]SEI53107.1 transcriptional regulator, AsnC family [Halohasta litchfieldiae]
MVHAFVMVKTDVAASESLLGMIRDLDPVTEAHIVAREYDLIVELSVDEVYDVLQTTASEIQSLDGVLETKTYMSLED